MSQLTRGGSIKKLRPCLELEAKRSQIKDAIKWLESQGMSVEPVEINVIES